ncbi:RTX family hemolysin [Escherichia coli]|uniref:RTX family hemolysin n=1 Tax=Escherichia coli TaxID=562 RepID=UPI00175E8219|nr:RTX family hemolysin [Escherichia coli]EFE4632186.1 RTX family hemolysin [Escherichia coli]EGC2529309.1 RTX family hemolysin [Escherichia coli]EGK5916177.1 RTX family hemolysin [Escherichia coli]MCZ0231054.1 RTX family hemolysin [Escherichia coli]MCZ0343348.1 RTX family hemolysin [Escherichia coli]
MTNNFSAKTVPFSNANNIGKKIILLLPDKHSPIGATLHDLAKAAKELNIEIQSQEKNEVSITKEIFNTTEQLLGVTEKGVVIFGEKLDSIIKKYDKLSHGLGGSAESFGDRLGHVQNILATIQGVLGVALSGKELDELIKKQQEGEPVSQSEIARVTVGFVSELIDTFANASETLLDFSEQLREFGSLLKYSESFKNIGDKLQKFPNLSKFSGSMDFISGILSAVSAGIILGQENSDVGTKTAAGVELTTKVLGNIGKYVSQSIISQRAALGLSTTAAGAGLIASAVSLAISPLSFLSLSENFNKAYKLEAFSERFKKIGYEGDALLGSFYQEAGVINSSLTSINTALNAITSGVGAASAASLIGAPISALVSGITGIITGILEASKQSMFEHVASKLATQISEWEEKYGKNYFENGYDARYKVFLEDSHNLLQSYADKYSVERAVIITQKYWDAQIGELAGITYNGEKISSGKAYIDSFQQGEILKKQQDKFEKKEFDPLNGDIDLSNHNVSTLLKFETPLLTPGNEIRERKQSGKYEYITKLVVKGVDKWSIIGINNKDAIYDLSNIIQFASLNDGLNREIKVDLRLGSGNDKVFAGNGSLKVNAGDGHDIVYYNNTDTGYLTIDGSQTNETGNYQVTRELGADVKILKEVVKEQNITVGKRTETLQYRHYELDFSGEYSLLAKDTLISVEEIIGSNRSDKFIGSKFNDIFYGADGDDSISGNDGNDRLYGGNGNDDIKGGSGDDQLYGDNGNDILNGNSGNNYLYGGDGNDELQVIGNDGKNVLLGGRGDDRIYGSGGSDLIDGGVGNDYLNGYYGNDIYIYRKEYGHHIIDDIGGAEDILSIYNFSVYDIALKRNGNDLIINKYVDGVLSFNENNDVNGLTIKNWFDEKQSNKIEKIIDKDGKIITSDIIDSNIKKNTKNNSYILGSDLAINSSEHTRIRLRQDVSNIISTAGGFDINNERLGGESLTSTLGDSLISTAKSLSTSS